MMLERRELRGGARGDHVRLTTHDRAATYPDPLGREQPTHSTGFRLILSMELEDAKPRRRGR